jgi:hypothetical protein
MAAKAQFTKVNEHFKAIFNAAMATQVVFEQLALFGGSLEGTIIG